MPAKIDETHILSGKDSEVKVVVWDNGDVDVWIGSEQVSPVRLGEIVAFVETHGQVSVKSDD